MENKTPALVVLSAVVLSLGIGLFVNATYSNPSSSTANVLIAEDYRCEELEQKMTRSLTAEEKEWYERNCKSTVNNENSDPEAGTTTNGDTTDKPTYDCDSLKSTTQPLTIEQKEWYQRNCTSQESNDTSSLTCEELKRKIMSGQYDAEIKEEYYKRCEPSVNQNPTDKPQVITPDPVDKCEELKKLMELGSKEAAEKYKRICEGDEDQDKEIDDTCVKAKNMCDVIEKILANENKMSDKAKKRLMELCKREQNGTKEDNSNDTKPQDESDEKRDQDESGFTDTEPGSLEDTAAQDLREKGLVKGFDDGTLRGKDLITRAQTLKLLLVGKFGKVDDIVSSEDEQKILERFRDLKTDDWSKIYFILGEQLGVTKGFDDGTVRPHEPVTTAQFLKMMGMVYKLSPNLPYSYKDVDDVHFVKEWAGLAEKYNLFPDRVENLEPDNYLTRKDVIVALYQYYTYTE